MHEHVLDRSKSAMDGLLQAALNDLQIAEAKIKGEIDGPGEKLGLSNLQGALSCLEQARKAMEKCQPRLKDPPSFEPSRLDYLASFPERNPNLVLEICLDGRMTYLNPAVRRLFPDLEQQGFAHPFLAGLGQIREMITGRPDDSWMIEVAIEARVYQQSIFYLDESRCLRIYSFDITERAEAEEALRASEAKYRSIVETANEGIWMVDLQGRTTYVNQKMIELLGYSQEEIQGKTMYQFMTEAEKKRAKKRLAQRQKGDLTPTSFEFEFLNKAGEIKWAAVNSGVLSDSEGNPTGIMGMLTDITERKKSEQALKESQSLTQAIMDGIPDPVYLKDRQGRLLSANPAALKAWGMSAEQALGKDSGEIYGDPALDHTIQEEDRRILESGQTCVTEARFPTHAGERVYLTTKSPWRDIDGHAIGLIGISHDITQRKERENELDRKNRTLRALSNINQTLLRASNEDDFMQAVCRIIVEDCGHAMVWVGFAEQDEARSVRPVASAGFEQGYLETLHLTWADTERGRGPTGSAIRTGQPHLCRNMHTDPAFEPWRAEATKRGYASSISLPLTVGGSALGALTIYSREPDPFSGEEVSLLDELAGDLAFGIHMFRTRLAHAKAEQALQESEEKYRCLVENIDDLVCEVDAGGRYTYINPQYEAILGYTAEDLLGHPANELIHPEDLRSSTPKFRQQVETQSSTHNQWRFRHKNGEWRWFDCAAQTYEKAPGEVSVVVISRDVTERKRAEERLAESERRYRSLFEGMTEGFAIHEILLDEEGVPCDYRFLDINPAFERLTGLKRENVVGKLLSEALPGDDPKWVKMYGEVALSGQPVHFENYSPGLKRHFDVFAYRPAAGQFAVIFMDISDKKMAQVELEAVRAEAELEKLRLEAVMEALPVGVAIADAQGGLVNFNEAYFKIWGEPRGPTRSVEDYAGYRAWWVDTGRQVEPHEWASALAIEKGETVIGQTLEIERFDGERGYVYNSAAPVLDAEGNVTGSAIAVQDISDLRQAELALADANAFLERRVNERTEQLQTLNEELSVEIEVRKQGEARIRQAARRSEVLAEVTRAITASRLDEQAVLETVTRLTGEMLGEISIAWWVEEDDAIKPAAVYAPSPELETRVKRILDRIHVHPGDGLLRKIYQDGESLLIAKINQATVRVLERDYHLEEAHLVHSLLVVPICLDSLAVGAFSLARLQAGNPYSAEDQAMLQSLADTAAVTIHKVRLYNQLDKALREEQMMRNQLIQAEKNSALARMVASVAHEINNPVQTIKNCLYLLRTNLSPESPLLSVVNMATSETNRIGDLVSRLRELYRPSKDSTPKLFNVIEVIKDTHSVLAPHLQHQNVAWSMTMDTHQAMVMGVADQMKQVFLNICLNAIDAMEACGGSLAVEVTTPEPDQVWISFKDNGPGILSEDLPFIFDPFYTTKEKGSGLGLAISSELVRSFGGEISVETQAGAGACFTVHLPRVGCD